MVDSEEKSAPPGEGLSVRLARNMAQRRRELHLTQAQVAEKLCVEVETLSRFERGKHLPSLATLERISQVLGTTVADLLAEVVPPARSDVQTVEVWLSGLRPADREFALEVLKRVCDHLTLRGNSLDPVQD